MGLFNRAIQYAVTNTETGYSQNFFIAGDSPLAPLWCTSEYNGALELPAVRRAASLISDLIAGFPYHAYRGDVKIDPTPSLLLQPNPLEQRVETISSMVLDYVLEGNSISVIAERDSTGYPSAIIPVPASTVQVRMEDGVRKYRIGDHEYLATDVLHIKALSAPGSLRGKGIMEYHLGSLELAGEQLRQARNVSVSGVPTVVLTSGDVDMTPDEATDLKAKWMLSQQTRTPAVLNSNTSFQSVSWDPTQTQLIEARKLSATDIARMFGLPASMLDADGNSRTYTNSEQAGLDLLRFTISGHLRRFEQAFSSCFPRGTDVLANTDSLLRTDTVSRYNAHKTGIEAGFLLKSEARALENLVPIPGIDVVKQVAPPVVQPIEEAA